MFGNKQSLCVCIVIVAFAFLSQLSHSEAGILDEEGTPKWMVELSKSVALVNNGKYVDAERTIHAVITDSDNLKNPYEKHYVISVAYSNLGQVYSNWGKYDLAEKYLLKSLKMKEMMGTAGIEEALKTASNLGILYRRQGRYLDAKKIYEKYLVFVDGKPEISMSAIFYNNFAEVLRFLNEYEKSEKYYQKAFDIHKARGEEERSAIVQSNIGSVYILTKQYNKAISAIESALSVFLASDKDFIKSHIGTTYGQLGLAYVHVGNKDKAIESIERGIEETIKFYSSDHPDVAERYAELGLAYMMLGQPENAVSPLEKSMTLYKETLGTEHHLYKQVQEMVIDAKHNAGL